MPEFHGQQEELLQKYQAQLNYLYKDEIADKMFKLYKRGVSLREVAKACAVSDTALRLAYPSLDWGNRGKIIFFKNHLKEKEAHAKKKREKQVAIKIAKEVSNEINITG